MNTKMNTNLYRAELVPWLEPGGHHTAYSKMLVNPELQGSRFFDFRISSYPVSGYAEAHVHDVAEQIYYFLEGTGLIQLGDEEHIVGPHTVMYVAPGVKHAVANTGFQNLVFIVVTSPPEDIERPTE
jgi:mannose-6-phosphate isomerase-like protein (cupin superfamily)